MSWRIRKLSDCCLSIADGDHQPPPKAATGVPFVTISDITSTNQFDFSDTMFVPQDYYDRLDSKRKAQKGDVLYSVVGSFGIPVYVKENIPFVFQRHIAILRPNETLLPQFLYYTMLSRDFYMMADAAAIGAAQRTVSLSALRNMEIAVPSMETQQKIVDILSAYDGLIENNQKQIKLLEEATQRLYKEWFVDLHFPGHETNPIVDGVPEGWSIEELGEIAVLKAGGDKPKVFSKVKTIECSVPVFSNGTENEGLYGFTNLAEISDVCVTISARGSVGYTCLRKEAFVPIVRLITVIPKKIEVEYLFCFLKHTAFDSNGAAQQQITVPMIKSKQVLLPSKTVMDLFVSDVRPMMDLRERLKCSIHNLSDARDRLLPKLMSGEIEV